MTRVLALDVGGTNVRFAIAEVEPLAVTLGEHAHHPTKEFASFEQAILSERDWFTKLGVERCAIGVAGPVNDGVCKMSNLGWTLDSKALTKTLGMPTRVINDFEAIAFGVRYVPSDQRATLQEGTPNPLAPVAILGAGTGLGEALLLHGHKGERVMPTEGGHATLAPSDDEDAGFIAFARKKLNGGHVSVERALSGTGLTWIVEWMEQAGLGTPGEALRAAMKAGDPAAAIGKAGADGSDPVARAAVDRFVRFYGAEAGNLALKSIARGGVFVAGGIAPKMLSRIQEGFMRAFLDKGRMRPLLDAIPVHVILDGDVGLRGSAASALNDDDF